MRLLLVSAVLALGLSSVSLSDGARTTDTFGPWVGDSNPLWSRDGERIAFQRWHRFGRRGSVSIFELPASGGPSRLLRKLGVVHSVVVAPDFSAAAVVRESGLEIVELSSGARTPIEATYPHDAVWSADGRRLAFTATSGVFVATRDGATHYAARGAQASWSPDGTHLAFVAQEGDPPVPIVSVVRADGAGDVRRLGGWTMPRWSPDGSRIVWIDHGALVVGDPEGSLRRRYLHPSFTNASAPAWSPDGTRVAATVEDGRALAFDLESGRKTYLTRRHVRALAWSPTGRTLAFGLSDPGCQRPGVGLVAAAGGIPRKLTLDCRIEGTNRNDTLRGTELRDLIFGRVGDDRLSGRGGDDRLEGGPGRDTIRCGPGVDSVYADRLDRVAADCERVARG